MAENVSSAQLLNNLCLSVDDDLTQSLTESIQLGKFLLIPPSKVSWLGEDAGRSSVSATVDGEQWQLRLRAGKLQVKTMVKAKVSMITQRLKQLTGVQMFGTGITMKWEEKKDYDAGLVSEVLMGRFGMSASRWILDHIWRGNILVSSKSSTSCYCPTLSSDEGYKICALIPFDVISDTRFYYHRDTEKLYWMPRHGEKLREVCVSRGGSIVFIESEFESEDLERCSVVVDKCRRVG